MEIVYSEIRPGFILHAQHPLNPISIGVKTENLKLLSGVLISTSRINDTIVFTVQKNLFYGNNL